MNTTVQEIHNKVYSAEKEIENLVFKINEGAIKKASSDLSAVKGMGFSSISNVDPAATQSKNESLFNKISDLKERNPFVKFITENQLEEICKKYNLVMGWPSIFKADIPVKNIKEIADFKMKDEDLRSYSPSITIEAEGNWRSNNRWNYGSLRSGNFSMGGLAIPPAFSSPSLRPIAPSWLDLSNADFKAIGEAQKRLEKREEPREVQQSMVSGNIGIYDNGVKVDYTYMSLTEEDLNIIHNSRRRHNLTYEDIKQNLSENTVSQIEDLLVSVKDNADTSRFDTVVVATTNHFDLLGKSVVNHRIVEEEVPFELLPAAMDPIVLKKTKHDGILAVVTAWGDEANDPLLINELYN